MFIYSAGSVGFFGEGYFFHRFYNFPKLKFITKTLTLLPKRGYPFAVIPFGNSVWNKISLHNSGFFYWLNRYIKNGQKNDAIVSIAGSDREILKMVNCLNFYPEISGIELNFSCPNIKNQHNKLIPESIHPLYLKLNYKQNPFDYDLSKINFISVNSIPTRFGGLSGKIAQKYNWPFIEMMNKAGLKVLASSWTSEDDINKLKDIGCKYFAIGSVILTNPRLVEKIGKDISLGEKFNLVR